MGITDRKEREKEEMKRRILDSAKNLFLEVGFEKTSIRNIAEAIEYSPATIYLYFKDKNELLFTLHQEALIEFTKTFARASTSKDPFERLVKLGREYLTFALENPELYELMFLLNAPMDSLEIQNLAWEEGLSVFKALEALVQICKDDGYFKNLTIQEASMMIWGTVHGLATIQLRRRTNMFEESERESRIYDGFEALVEMVKHTKE